LVTFDDGWVDNAENALPVLRAENIPAVIFLPVGFIGACRLFTREALTHLLVEAVKASRQDPEIRKALSGHLSPFGLDHVLDADEDAALQTAIDAVQVYRHANGPKFETLVANLCDVLKVSQEQLSDIDTFMDWTHVEQMGQQGVSFGGHGVHHRVLTEVHPDEARLEVETSKQALDARLPQPVRAFAYPNGGCNPRVAEIVDAVGYGLAFGVEPGFVACNDDRLRLRRINIHEDLTRSTPMFLARLAGIF
jgi:peptidoglycan/xylan/chitin deacetylase (PgdA/CDA1 family)